jgi:hypothetical protein
MTDKQYEQIIEILINFDFEKVHQAMAATGWTWASCGRETPSAQELRERVVDLLKECIDRKTYISTGGFMAGYENDVLSLDFTVDSWVVDYEI